MILCVGTTPTMQRTMAFDRLTIDDVNRAAEVHEHASGKALNVARVLGVLGEAALAAGFYGGRRGAALLEDIQSAHIPHDFVRTRRETRLCTTVIDRATGQATELVEEAPPASADEWERLIARLDAHVASARAVAFSGTLAPGAPIDFCDRWVGRAPLVLVDAKGEAMRRALAARGGRVIAKLNRAELAQTLDEPLDTDAALFAAMRRAAPKDGWVVVTMGKGGAAAYAEGRLIRVTAPAVDAVSAIGSGDSFAAGLLAGVVRGGGVEDALRLATACGVANALTPFSGHVRHEDVEPLSQLVKIQSM